MRKLSIITFLLWLSSVSAFSQSEAEFKKLALLFPGEPYVYLKNSKDVNVSLEDGKLKVICGYLEERMFMNSNAGIYSSSVINYSDELSKISNIEAGTLVPNHNKYKEIKVKDFVTDKSLSKGSVFYGGENSISYFFPSLQQGAKTYERYSLEMLEPRLMSAFFFQHGAPVYESTFTVTFPNDVEIDWKLFNVPDSIVSFTKKQTKNKTSCTWLVKNLHGFSNETDAPNLRYFSPHIYFWIKSYKSEGKTTKMLGTTDDLYNWYYSLIKESNKDESPALKTIVDSLVSNTSDTLTKVKNIYYWVQDNIKYIAIENGMEGFIPRSGKLVCERRYGDCKDMASIINKMLTYAGIPSHMTWIGSRDIPYKYKELPTPAIDNHMIVTFKHKGKYYFLDGTGRHIPFGTPTSFIQDKEALIAKDDNSYEVHAVPIVESSKNFLSDSIEISINKNKVTGNANAMLTGYWKINMAYGLPTNRSEHKNYFREYFSKASNKFLIDTVSFKDLYTKDGPVMINYQFNIEDYVKFFDKEIYVNLQLDKNFLGGEIKKDRVADIEIDFNSLKSTVVTLNIPDGYQIKHIPDDYSYKDKNFGFTVKYKKANKKVIATTEIYSESLLIKKTEFESWNKMHSELKKSYSELVILKKE